MMCRRAAVACAALVALAAPALAQDGGNNPFSTRASNLPGAAGSEIAPALPNPEVGPNAGPRAYLHAARVALATGRTGEAQQALEMAETRALDRSTPLFQTDRPSGSPLVARIGAARRALGAGDTAGAMRATEAALSLFPPR